MNMNNLYSYSENIECDNNTLNNNTVDLAIAITLSVLDGIIAIIAILGNALIIFTVQKFRHLRTPTNLFVVAISFSDLLTALTIPYYVSFYFDDVSYVCIKYACKLRYLFTMFSTLWSLLLMIGLAVDRYIAVLKPLRYNCLVQRKRVIKSIWISALYMAIICFLPLLYEPNLKRDYQECDLYYIVGIYYAGFGVCAHVVLTIVVTSILYWKIYREAILHKKKTPTAFHKRWETNMTIMMMLILGVHLITLLPYLIVVMLRYAVSSDNEMQETLSLVKKCTTVLYFSKSIANPFICAVRNKGFRLAFRHILGYGRNVPKNDFSIQISNIPTRVPPESLF